MRLGLYEIKRVLYKIGRREGILSLCQFFYHEFKLTIWRPLIKKSWSGSEEDIIIDNLLGNKKTGYYVDVGAYDAWVGSNTKRFYNKGWQGIIIEPDVVRYRRFLKDRKNDINLNIGLSDKPSKLTFYVMFPESLSTFSREMMEKRRDERYTLIKEVQVQVDTLANIFTKCAGSKEIDFISIDTEGYDYNVLLGNDWKKYKPKVICVEKSSYEDQERIEKYLRELGYIKATETIGNLIYTRP